MKLERGMGTLMTVFSGVAALMCLLVGLQLLSLEERIGREAVRTGPQDDGQFRQWEAEVRTGAVMSFGAGLLILLFGLRHQATSRRARNSADGVPETVPPGEDPDAWSIRIFEVDQDERSIEITAGQEMDSIDDLLPEPQEWAPLAEEDLDLEPGDGENPADSILDSIREAADTDRSAPSRRSGKSFWSRIFRR